MGVPAFFRWLSKKYPAIVVHVIEEDGAEVKGKITYNTANPNPNGVEFDNLYLDMNGIIHPCTHPEDKPAPKNEDEMMVAIFAYIDRIFNMCRPRKLLYMAIDGVAPRAKMNQQRSRRFRSAKEAHEKELMIANMREQLELQGKTLPPPKSKSEHFDSNCITPGTEFMDRLAVCLRYYVHEKITTDSGWKDVKVILSDANVPGEGEHKIMDYIRKQRSSPSHDPNTKHCLCGADADLIMLGLATHEAQFTIIREEFKPGVPKPCDLCKRYGHELQDCQGLDEISEAGEKPIIPKQEFIFIRLNVLREYLERDFNDLKQRISSYDFERLIDDWVFMCFFVGNDFLPHLPSLEIREGAIDRLIRIYKGNFTKMGGYISHNGIVDLQRVQYVLRDLGKEEDSIFRNRQERELNYQRKIKAQGRTFDSPPKYGRFGPKGLDVRKPVDFVKAGSSKTFANANSKPGDVPFSQLNQGNRDTAAKLKAFLTDSPNDAGEVKKQSEPSSSRQISPKRKLDEANGNEGEAEEVEEEEVITDQVRLYENGWRERYYKLKFGVEEGDLEDFQKQIAEAYVRGLCWVMRYYYQGCASWKWYYPYHYAPFASDFINIDCLDIKFPLGTKPFRPLEQLMAVFPAASKEFLPFDWQALMWKSDSPILDSYPTDFSVDLNGKKYAWQGVALLPHVEEKRLLRTVRRLYKHLTEDEARRNTLGVDYLFVGRGNDLHKHFEKQYEKAEKDKGENADYEKIPVADAEKGIAGETMVVEDFTPYQKIPAPVADLDDLKSTQCMQIVYRDPVYVDHFIHPAKRLAGIEEPAKVLGTPEAYRLTQMSRDANRRGRGDRGRGDRGRGGRGGFSDGAAQRHIEHHLSGNRNDNGHNARGNYNARGRPYDGGSGSWRNEDRYAADGQNRGHEYRYDYNRRGYGGQQDYQRGYGAPPYQGGHYQQPYGYAQQRSYHTNEFQRHGYGDSRSYERGRGGYQRGNSYDRRYDQGNGSGGNHGYYRGNNSRGGRGQY